MDYEKVEILRRADRLYVERAETGTCAEEVYHKMAISQATFYH